MTTEGNDHSVKGLSPHKYRCGLISGDLLQVVQAIPRYDHTGVKTGEYAVGEIWKVLRPSINIATGEPDSSVVWLQQPDGRMHTWDDDSEIFEFFQKLTRHPT